MIFADGEGNQRIYTHSNGYIGIGLGNDIIPQNRLEVKHGVNGNSGLRFTNLNELSSTVTSNGKVLTVNEDGDVVLTTDQGSGASTVINASDYINLTGNGSSGNPYIISAENIYNVDVYSHHGILKVDSLEVQLHPGGKKALSNGF